RGRLEQVEAEARRMSALCRHVLDEPHGLGPVRVERVAAEVVDSARTTFTGTIELSARPAVVTADRVALNRALANVVDNACRAAGPAGEVRQAARARARSLRIRVGAPG